MDVSVSPDGQTLVFDLLGDLFTVPVKGGKATQITRGLALNSSPVWSPDGKKIAYVSDFSGASHVNVRNISGSYHSVLGPADPPLGSDQYPVWSPDGNYIAVDTSIYGLAGGKASLPGKILNPMSFPANARFLYWQRFGLLYKYDPTNKKSVAFFDSYRPLSGAALSPDSRWLAYVADSNAKKCLLLRDLVNNSERILVSSLLLEYPHYRPYVQPHFSFSANSRTIFIGFGGKIHRLDIEKGTDEIIPFEADIKADLGPFDYNTFRVRQDSVMVKYTRYANASPDGKQLVFSALNKVYVMDLPNGRARVLVDQPMNQYQPVYSPDGKWIAYVSWCDTAGGALWRVPAAGGQAEKLTAIAGHYECLAWSPDGASIMVIRGEPRLGDRTHDGFGELELISLGDRSKRVIDDSVPIWNRLAFSVDGRKIIYEPKDRRGQQSAPLPQLVSRDLMGKDQQTLTIAKDRYIWHGEMRHQSLSPDGRFAVYSMREDLYLVPLFPTEDVSVVYDPKPKLSVIRFARGLDPFWEKGGKVLSWSYGNRFYRIAPDKIVAAAQKKIAFGSSTENIVAVSVPPDESVDLAVSVPGGAASGSIALRNVRIITMKGVQIIEHGTILIKNGRFVAIGPDEKVIIPAGAKILDLAGTTVMPGFVDMHLHMGDVSTEVFPQQSWIYLINLAYGITTARDPYTSYDAFGYSEAVATGQMLGPRLFNVGRPAIGIADIEGASTIDSLNDAREYIKKRALIGATVIKQYMLPRREQRQWLVMAAREAGLNMTNEGYYEPLLQLGQLKDGSTGIEHNPNRGEIYKDELLFIGRAETYLTPTLITRYGGQLTRHFSNYIYWRQPDSKLQHFMPNEDLTRFVNRHPEDTARAGFLYPANITARIHQQGGRVLLGSHGDDEGICVHNELWALQMGGFSNMEALQAATIKGAKGLGVQQDLGSIEVGKIADLLVLNKNPLDDIHNSREIRYVMKDGVLYDANTLDEIWPVVKKCPDWRFHAGNDFTGSEK